VNRGACQSRGVDVVIIPFFGHGVRNVHLITLPFYVGFYLGEAHVLLSKRTAVLSLISLLARFLFRTKFEQLTSELYKNF